MHALSTTGRAPEEIRISRTFAVKRFDDLLGTHRHQIGRSGSEVDLLFGMARQHAPAEGIRRCRGCTHIGVGHGIVEGEEVGQGSVDDKPSNAAVAGSQVSSVPAGVRHPDFDLDVRVGGRRQGGRDPAKRRQIGEDLPVRCAVGPGRDRLGARDRSVRQHQASQAHACRGTGGCGADADNQDEQRGEEYARSTVYGRQRQALYVALATHAPHGGLSLCCSFGSIGPDRFVLASAWRRRSFVRHPCQPKASEIGRFEQGVPETG